MYDPRDIIIRPVISEKSYDMIALNRYTFEVAKTASKPQIAQAVTDIFGVTVTSVNTMNVTGKPRRVRVAKGKTRDWKKAVVTLKEGDSIEFFQAH
ncbi:MAG: 50S ribosomal protein L23 [Coriobacteriia bacterium]|nr:50S ribosomal protein L23 [Coriobacteriia bacterium]